MKRWTKIALPAAIGVVAALTSLPLFINANTFRPVIEKQLSTVLGREVKVGSLRFSGFSRSLIATDLSISDDPAFSPAPFLTAQELRVRVALSPLLFAHEIHIRQFVIESPQVVVIRAANGTWNFSSIGHAIAAAKANAAPNAARTAAPIPLPDLQVSMVNVHDARISASSLPAHGQPTIYNHVNISVGNFSFLSSFPLELTADLPAGGTVSISGHAGPINRDDAATTPLDVQLTVMQLNPVAAAFLNPKAGIALVADIDMHAASDGTTLTTTGTVHMQNLKLRSGAAASPKPVDLSYSGTHVLKQNSGVVQEATIKIGNSAVHLTGTYQPFNDGSDNPVLNLKVTGQSLPVDDLQPLMTAMGIRLPNNAVLKGGTVGLNFAINGQADALTIAGNVAADNTQMVGFDVGSKIHGIAALSGVQTGDTTNIQKLRATVRITNGGVTVSQIDGVIPEMGELTGAGTVSPASQLDFNLTVQVASAKGIGKVGVGVLSALNGSSNGAKGVPMKVAGTPDEPVITADVSHALGKTTKSIAGFFTGKKKKDE